MSNGSLVGLTDQAVSSDVTMHHRTNQHRQSGERHCQRKKGARPFQDGAKGIRMSIHIASASWEDALTKRRPKDICRSAKAAAAVLQKCLKLLAIALTPV